MKLAPLSLALALLRGRAAARPETNGQPPEIRSVDGLLEATLDVSVAICI